MLVVVVKFRIFSMFESLPIQMGFANSFPHHGISSQHSFYSNSSEYPSYGAATSNTSVNNGASFDDHSLRLSSNASILRSKLVNSSFAKTSSKQLKQINELEDDVHLCISCLRALMNNKAGWNIVFDSAQAIYCIVRSILHHSLR